MNVNKVILAGRLTRDPETMVTPGGLTIAKLGFATSRKFRTKDGEQREDTLFVDVTAFGNQAETIQKYCSKGSGLYLEGRLKLEQWEDRNTGDRRSKLSVDLESFQFFPKSNSDPSAPSASSPRQAPRKAAPPTQSTMDDFSDDDVPF